MPKKLNKRMEGRVELLRTRAQWLNGRDRLLMNLYLNNDNTFRQMARMAGVNEATIARRIHKIVRRLLDAHYINALRHSKEFTLLQMNILRDYFIEGYPQRRIAVRYKCSRYYVRKTLLKVERLSNEKAQL